MSVTASDLPSQRKVSAWQGLLLVLFAALFAWAPGSEHPAGYSADQAEVGQADRLAQAGFVEITPAPAPDRNDLETISEQLEERLLAVGNPDFGFEPEPEGEPPEYGVVVAWAICTPSFQSSTARGPPVA